MNVLLSSIYFVKKKREGNSISIRILSHTPFRRLLYYTLDKRAFSYVYLDRNEEA